MAKKQEWKKGWKVITRHTRRSCTGRNRTRQIKYPKNEIVSKPHLGGPLAVFETRESARDFRNNFRYNDWAIKKCIYIESKNRCLWEWRTTFMRYKKEKKYKRIRSYQQVPKRTAFADKVKCLE